jgi:hypothetical protein
MYDNVEDGVRKKAVRFDGGTLEAAAPPRFDLVIHQLEVPFLKMITFP